MAMVAVMTHLVPLHIRFAPVAKVWEAEKPPGEIRFEFNDKGTMLHLSENSARWSNLVGELVREFPMYYLSWHKIEEEKRAHIMGWLMMKSSATREYPSLIWTFFDIHTYDGVFTQDEAWVQYEMLSLRGLRANMPLGVSYTKKEIMAMVRKGKQRGHIPGFDSQREINGGSGSGSDGGGDDEPDWDKDIDGDENADEDEDILYMGTYMLFCFLKYILMTRI
ncbi:hypothetical protein Tco_0980470 [Tanacetum coccineum]